MNSLRKFKSIIFIAEIVFIFFATYYTFNEFYLLIDLFSTQKTNFQEEKYFFENQTKAFNEIKLFINNQLDNSIEFNTNNTLNSIQNYCDLLDKYDIMLNEQIFYDLIGKQKININILYDILLQIKLEKNNINHEFIDNTNQQIQKFIIDMQNINDALKTIYCNKNLNLKNQIYLCIIKQFIALIAIAINFYVLKSYIFNGNNRSQPE